MSDGELWSTLVTAIDPHNIKAMPAVLQSTITLLESELGKARSALQEIQPNALPVMMLGDEVTAGAMAAYRKNLVDRASHFVYGTQPMTAKDLGLVTNAREVSSDDDDTVVDQDEPMVTVLDPRPTLVDVLSNNLILDHIAPYLSVSSLLSLAATSGRLHSAVFGTPYVFRYLDLSRCRGAQMPRIAPIDVGGEQWRNERMDESLTEDEFYSGPLRGIFSNLGRRSILQDVRTLILDGLSVPADLVADIVLTDRFNVTILSIRDCLHLNERKLIQTLQHAVRPTRPKGTPRVKGIYHFTPRNAPRSPSRAKYRDWWSSQIASSASRSAETTVDPNSDSSLDDWYKPSGKLLKGSIEEGWAQTLKKCEGIIAFDAVLCRGPRHDVNLFSSNENGPQPEGRLLGPAIATVALGPSGCDRCHKAPEGFATWGQSPDEQFPLLSPPPLHSSKISPARCPVVPGYDAPLLLARCNDCVTDRWCHRCNKWFCSSCLPQPGRVNVRSLSPHQTASRGPRANQTAGAEEQERRRLGPAASLILNGLAKVVEETTASSIMKDALHGCVTGATRAPVV
ncbi:hypothetical protein NFIA_028700 [Paecilomyces variotii No. 5]|uniref:Uncharacterized protein n=1 Tax=Byssochlamys spectabilis (strain No. 5 / NBRC 109023) TaxID=1356009 RepID=V5FS88_BYSSN|nr:hypothetical protein NFIA_028700 [Paecilomyces variotii No. 5]